MEIFSNSEHRMLFRGAAVSLVLLIVLMLLQGLEVKAMSMEIHWIAVAALPLFVAMIVGGYIYKFDAFGLSFESAMQESAEPEAYDDPATVIVDQDGEKESLSRLRQMSDQEKEDKVQLKFRAGRASHYSAGAVEMYMADLPNLSRFLILGEDDKYLGTVPVSEFTTTRGPSRPKLREFVGALEANGVEAKYGTRLSDGSLPVGTSVADAYSYCVDKNVDAVPVVDENGKYAGIYSKASLAQDIADKAINAMKKKT